MIVTLVEVFTCSLIYIEFICIRTLAERNRLNQNINEAINVAAADWGIRCLRYEIRKQFLAD